MDFAGSVVELERTHIPLPVVNAAVEELGYTTNSMVKAIGGDRAVEEPLNEHWRPVYVGGTRWLPRTALGRISSDLRRKRPGQGMTSKYAQYKRAADEWWQGHGGEAAKQAVLAPNM